MYPFRGVDGQRPPSNNKPCGAAVIIGASSMRPASGVSATERVILRAIAALLMEAAASGSEQV